MIIAGLQKLTLLDYPGKTACTVFTLGCNFRCKFCHNSPLVTESESTRIEQDEILQFLQTRKGKLDGICISGGEPLLQNGIVNFLKKVKDLGFLIKIDTNGSCFSRLEEIIKGGLCDFVAMDIKNSLPKYNLTCGCIVDTESILKSINLILNSGIDYEFRTTIVNELHEEEDIKQIASLIKGARAYHLQTFKDSGNILGKNLNLTPPDKNKMQQFKTIALNCGLNYVTVRGID